MNRRSLECASASSPSSSRHSRAGRRPPHAEYPHYAFTLAPEDFMGIKRRLEAFGVPTLDPWGRMNRPHALMYFRDPSGNQFELFCPNGFSAVLLRLGSRAGVRHVVAARRDSPTHGSCRGATSNAAGRNSRSRRLHPSRQQTALCNPPGTERPPSALKHRGYGR